MYSSIYLICLVTTVTLLLLLFHIEFSLSLPLTSITTRIKNGNLAEPKQFPWQTSIISYHIINLNTKYNKQFIYYNINNYNENKNENYLNISVKYCGGVIISSEWILTAAHCINGSNNLTLGFGSLDWEKPLIKVSDIDKIIINPGYKSKTHRNNIALIKLILPLELTENVATIRLPSKSQSDISFEGVKSVISGWGIIRNDSEINILIKSDRIDKYLLYEKSKNHLEWIELTVISNRVCSTVYGSIVQETTMCAQGNNGENVCGSDFGGPLITKDKNGGWMLIGIASFTQGCDTYNKPIGFTRITSFLDWISTETEIIIN